MMAREGQLVTQGLCLVREGPATLGSRNFLWLLPIHNVKTSTLTEQGRTLWALENYIVCPITNM